MHATWRFASFPAFLLLAACVPENFASGAGPVTGSTVAATAPVERFEPYACAQTKGTALITSVDNPQLANQYRALQVDTPKATIEYLAVRSGCYRVLDISMRDLVARQQSGNARPQRGSVPLPAPPQVDYEIVVEVQVLEGAPTRTTVQGPFGGTTRAEIARQAQAQIRLVDLKTRQITAIGRRSSASVDTRQVTAIIAGAGIGSDVRQTTPESQIVAAAVVLAFDDLVRSIDRSPSQPR